MKKQVFSIENIRLHLGFALRAFTVLAVAANLAACAKESFGSTPSGSPSSSPSGSSGGSGTVGVNGGGSGASGAIDQGSQGGTNSGSSTGAGGTSAGNGGSGATGSAGPAIVGGTLMNNGTAEKAYFSAPLCQRGTLCLGQFMLRQVLTAQLEFDWHTDDLIYQHPVTDGGAPFGVPNTDYVPTGGHIAFPAGSTEEDVHIQDISPNNVAIRIGVTMVNCTYGGAAIDCQSLFN